MLKLAAATSLLILVLPLASGSSRAQSVDCPGSLKQSHPHPFGAFNFDTNSLFEDVRNLPDVTAAGGYSYGIVSCADNPDPSNPMRLHWLVPGPDGWVQPKAKLNATPRLTNEKPPLQFDGCLEYGNRGDTTLGKFFGLSEDRSRIEDEHIRGCREVIARPGVSGEGTGKIQQIILKFKNFFPSDAKYPAKTMLKIEGDVGIRQERENQYTSFVTYEAAPFGDSTGSLDGMRLRPAFRGAAESLLSAFAKANGVEPIRIGNKGEVTFTVFELQKSELAYASYEVLDNYRQVVGSIPFPVLVPAPPRH